MPDPLLTAAIREAYAAAPVGVVTRHTIELRHPAFVDANGGAVAIRVVNGFKPLTARLEASAAMNAGEMVEFIALAFSFEEPSVGMGAVPEMTVVLDNVGHEIIDHLDRAAVSADKVHVTYRPYLSTMLDAGPQYDPPIHLVLTDVDVGVTKITGKARLDNAANRQYPLEVYTAENFPGLER